MELLRPTAPAEGPDDGPPDDESPDGEAREEQGGESQVPAPKSRRKRTGAPAGKTRARNLRLTDDVHDRIWQLARQRKQSVSAVANDLLDRALPRWEIKRQG